MIRLYLIILDVAEFVGVGTALLFFVAHQERAITLRVDGQRANYETAQWPAERVCGTNGGWHPRMMN